MKKKKDNGLKAVICLAVATIAVGVASIAVSSMDKTTSNTPGEVATITPTPGGSGNVAGNDNQGTTVDKTGTVLSVEGANAKIKEARLNEDGTYSVVIAENGFAGEIVIEAIYSADGQTLVSYDVLSHNETPGFGSKVDEDEYKAVLAGIKLPVTTNGLDISAILGVVEETPEAIATLYDGVYKAQAEPDENGNYGFVTVTVADGKVTSVVWDEMYGGESKAELAATGKYVMVEGNPTWKDQAEFLGAYVVENQTTEGILNEKGYTDAVSGVSIYVGGFVDLTNQAMEQASQAPELKDGVYKAQTEADDNGNYAFVSVTIEGGKITAVTWDEAYNGSLKSELSLTGKYAMKPVWDTQAKSVSKYVVDNQGTAGLLNASGYTDVVSGVSIYVGGFAGLADQAIAKANGADGVYEVAAEADDNGNYAFVTVTIEGGKITAVAWDEVYNGSLKSELSLAGNYAMKPVWDTQAKSMCQYVVDNQSTAGLNLTDAGKTDVVSGVSISVNGFTGLVEEALKQASVNGAVSAPVAPAPVAKIDATVVDVVSGATVSSKAVIRAINEGFVFLRDFVLNK